MNLFNHKKQKTRIIAGLVLRQENALLMLLELNEDMKTLKMIDEREFSFTGGWDNLVYDFDEKLFELENMHKIKVQEIMFFVYTHFSDKKTQQLKPQYQSILTSLVEEEKLTPLGYVDCADMIARYLKHKDQSPLSLILLEVDSPAVSAHIYTNNEVIHKESVAKTESITSDLEEILTHTQKNIILPTRIVMYDSKDLQSESSALLSHKWPESVFIQLPRVDIISREEFSTALTNELNIHFFGGSESIVSQYVPDTENNTENNDMYQVEPSQPAKADPTTSDNDLSGTLPAMGATASAPIAGFVIGGDVREDDGAGEFSPGGSDGVYEESVDKNSFSNSMHTPAQKSSIITTIYDRMSALSSKKGFIIGGIVLLLLGAVIAGMLFIHKAEITIYYTSEPIKKTIDINKNLPIKKNTITISEKGSVATTGNKLIGEKAKGQITIYNAEDTDKTFKKGTELETNDGLVYVLTEDVQAPSAEQTITEDGDILTTTTKTKANIEGKDIGKKYNIKSDVDLIIDGAPKKNHFARTSTAVTGGTEKEVQTASRDDYDRLKKDISKKITQKSNAEVSKANKSLKIISALTQVDILDETYSKEIGDETDTLELSAKAEVTYYSYNNDQMLSQISEQLQDDLDSKHTLSVKQIKYSFSNVDLDDDVVTGEIDVNAQPVLNIDSDALKSEIAGKSQGSIQDILKSKYGADGYDFAGNPQFPPFTAIAPLLKNNITISVKPL